MSTADTLEQRAVEAAPPAPVANATAAAHVPLLAAQAVAGAGNLLFAVLAAALLGRAAYADVVAFLGVYLLLHVPAAALTAAGAFAPRRLARARLAVARSGALAGIAIAVGCVPLAALSGLPLAMVLALAAAAPAAGMLGLERGLAYGRGHQAAVVRSLLIEPAVRLGAGVALTAVGGAPGAAVATVVGGYAALWTFRRGAPVPNRIAVRPRSDGDGGSAVLVAGSFVAIAVLQTVDLLIANRVLDAEGAAQFAVLSTLGGAAVFASATVPMLLMPSLAAGRERATAVAVSVAGAVGLAIAAAGALAAGSVLPGVFGNDVAPPASLVGLYLLAMASLGVARVLAADRCAAGDGRFVIGAVVGAVALEVAALVALADDVGDVVVTTFVAATALTAVLSFPAPRRHARTARELRVARPPWRFRTGLLAMVALCLVAADIRLATSRGLWVDEAISVRQAHLPFGQMLADMRTTDVHPPLHHVLLWITVRVIGASEAAVRLPSLIAGVALVPAMAWVGRVVYDRRTGWVAAALATIAPFCVWYSQEARMYALFMLFAALAIGAQVMAIRRGSRRDWLVYALCTAALIWTQYFAFLPVLVQQFAFAWVAWRDRRDRERTRPLLRGWAMSLVVVAIALIPLIPILQAQFGAYNHRSDGLVPGQAGANSSSIGGAISIYAVGANLIWGLWGYHADGVMVQVAALWPLLMLLALVMLGRGRSGPSILLLALVVVPMAALFLVGSIKRDLFELRYFSGAVPAMLLLGARVVTATARRRIAVQAAAGLLVVSMTAGLVDQQLNGANPRLYDFAGALQRVESQTATDLAAGAAPPVLLYEPAYLGDVIEYYAPDLDARPLASALPSGTGTVWVLATDRVINATDSAAKVGDVLAQLQQNRELVDTFDRPNVRVWELR